MRDGPLVLKILWEDQYIGYSKDCIINLLIIIVTTCALVMFV